MNDNGYELATVASDRGLTFTPFASLRAAVDAAFAMFDDGSAEPAGIRRIGWDEVLFQPRQLREAWLTHYANRRTCARCESY